MDRTRTPRTVTAARCRFGAENSTRSAAALYGRFTGICGRTLSVSVRTRVCVRTRTDGIYVEFVAVSVIAFSIASNPAADAAMPCADCATTLAAVRVPVTMPSDTGGSSAFSAGTYTVATKNNAPAGVAGEAINLGLTESFQDLGNVVTVTIQDIPSDWIVNGGTHNADGSWTVQTTDVTSLSVTTPTSFTRS